MLLSRVLEKLVSLAAVLLFLGTLVFPFLSFVRVYLLSIPEYQCDSIFYIWSFMMREEITCLKWSEFTHETLDYWFNDYWFHWLYCSFPPDQQMLQLKDEISWMLISLFSLQILTLSIAATSIFIYKKYLAFIPAALCPATTALMTLIFILINNASHIIAAYKIGYWLTCPSEALFIISLIINVKTKEPKQDH